MTTYDKFFHTIRLLFKADSPRALAEYLIALDVALKARLSEEDGLTLAAYFSNFGFDDVDVGLSNWYIYQKISVP